MNYSKHNLKLRLVSIVCIVSLVFVCLAGCQTNSTPDKDIVILYTNDVHCAIDTNIGYDGLAAYRDEVKERTPYVSLVDCGDYTQGEAVGALSKGQNPIDIMNSVGYDYVTLGNHEFDWGIDNLQQLISSSNASFLACNISYTGEGENKFSEIKPYAIETFGNTKVGFVGVTTPYTLNTGSKSFFMENDQQVYSFSEDSADVFYNTIQQSVDNCKKDGAKYVVLLSHLGETTEYFPFSSVDVIQNTNNIDAVLDAHEHSVLNRNDTLNKDGQQTILASTGTKFENMGELTIKADGTIENNLISQYDKKDDKISSVIAEKNQSVNDILGISVGSTDVDLLTTDATGIRLVRNRETTIGNLCADAIRKQCNSDIAFVNGGGIKSDIKKGDITLETCIKVFPYDNRLCIAKATGQDILDFLEISSSKVQSEYQSDGKVLGENGGFVQVSGLKYTIDASLPTCVKTDLAGNFESFDGQRRVSDVMILNANGQYEPIDVNKFYTVGGTEYVLKEGGDGNPTLENAEYLPVDFASDFEALSKYIKNLNSDFSKYTSTEGRITVK